MLNFFTKKTHVPGDQIEWTPTDKRNANPFLFSIIIVLAIYAFFPSPIRIERTDVTPKAVETNEYTAQHETTYDPDAIAPEPIRVEAKRTIDVNALKDDGIYEYVKRFADVARNEQRKYGIPASIKMAQAILESNAGKSELCRKSNNHFGIKCFSKRCAKGHCTNHNDDSHKDFFRIYETDWFSWRAHSEFLQKSRYKSLEKIAPDDYKEYARTLKKCGYATSPTYAKKLISLIEKYKLYNL